MFAVMQSFRLINSYTVARVAPGVGWQNINIETEQFTALIDLLFKTPLMPSLKSMPSGSTAPILINPFSEGGYLPHTGPGFVVIPESPEMVIKDDAQYGAIETHTSSAFTNLTRLANVRAGQVAMPGKAFAGINFNCGTFPERGKLSFQTEDGDKAMVELSVPHVLRSNRMVARKLIDIMSYFIGQSMIDADIENGVLTSDNIHVVSRIPEPVRKSPVKTLEEKLMECPVWATW
ncbi:hypothetical protein H8M15_22530 [Klebsiella pneumoniae]|uniref:hypothetical protein n=1 Tax=Klebsiella TaxID=570 RepID=UPI0013DE2AC7|nr:MULTISPECIES: hypothetical protein [Klebsiella]MBC4352288.1 hypothetical protein [Klebsiella pneumoniae]HCB1243138.1 hypothetical protein [Klebsiella quasipneumoniae subsp. quasipneumoniae]